LPSHLDLSLPKTSNSTILARCISIAPLPLPTSHLVLVIVASSTSLQINIFYDILKHVYIHLYLRLVLQRVSSMHVYMSILNASMYQMHTCTASEESAPSKFLFLNCLHALNKLWARLQTKTIHLIFSLYFSSFPIKTKKY
jgi:hypothetical protein